MLMKYKCKNASLTLGCYRHVAAREKVDERKGRADKKKKQENMKEKNEKDILVFFPSTMSSCFAKRFIKIVLAPPMEAFCKTEKKTSFICKVELC